MNKYTKILSIAVMVVVMQLVLVANSFAAPPAGGPVGPVGPIAPVGPMGGWGGGMRCYTVQEGDALSQIALDMNVDLQFLSMFNRIWDPNMIYAGQQLCVPPGAPRYMPYSPVSCLPPMNCGGQYPHPMPMPQPPFPGGPYPIPYGDQGQDMPDDGSGAMNGLGMQPQFGMPPMQDSMMGYSDMQQPQFDPAMMGQQPQMGYGQMPQQFDPTMMGQQPQMQMGYSQMDPAMMGQQPQMGYGQMPQQMDPAMMGQQYGMQQPVNYVTQ